MAETVAGHRDAAAIRARCPDDGPGDGDRIGNQESPFLGLTRDDRSNHHSCLASRGHRHRAGLAAHRHVVSAHAHERRPYADVGDPHSLSLIGFGFTIFQFFQKMHETGTLIRPESARNFGMTLVALGVLMLICGIIYHLQFMFGLRDERKAMIAAELIHGESTFPPSLTLVTAVVLLLIGIAAILSMIFQIGPF